MALENEQSQSSVGERRGQRLAPLQTNFSRPTSRPLLVTSPRTQRPRPEEYQNDEEHNERVPLQSTPVKRQSSKSGLRGLFGREKTARKPPSDAKLSGIDEMQYPAPQGEPGPAAPLSPTFIPTPVAAPSSTEPHRAKTPSKSRGRQSEDKPGSDDTAWKPPPLFQAFPQAIKHDTLPSPGLSVDSILRFHATSAAKSGNAPHEDHPAQISSKGSGADDAARQKKEAKEKRKHLRTLSDTIGKTEWSQKVYVLATSGYILQYSGGGKHDRLPEKMLQLGPKSVAFASDAIPGKHWVLQVSQSSEEQSSTNTESHRPLLSRFGFHRTHAKRLARSFLLVFHTPEDLSSWLLAVRAQIEARGGKKYVTERVFDDDMEHQLHPKTSTRQLVRKDPNRFSQTFLQPQKSNISDGQESTLTDQSRRSSHVSLHRRSVVLPSAPESRSESFSTTHTEWTSPVSGNGQGRFYSSVPPPGVATSPPKNNEKSAINTVLSALDSSGSPAPATPRKRQSLNLQQVSSAEEIPEIPRSQSVAPDPLLRSASPPAPNFSVPSFSQRFAARSCNTRLSHMPGSPCLRANDMPADPAEIMSNFSSPPQSPGKPPSNFGSNHLHEQQLPYHDAPRKPLRVSNSEDSLADPQRREEPKPHRYSRIPMNNMVPPRTTSYSSRPLSAIKNEAVEARVNASLAALPPGTADTSAHREQKRNRTSVLHRADSGGRPVGLPMPRRKSMPGLGVVGPPSVPPPNCPLPKIPSPIDPVGQYWPEPPTLEPRAGTPSRKFRLSSMPHSPANGRATPSGQRSASRQSRLPVS